MARMTLLEMTQNIMSAMTSDHVNSINDTTESQQVAEIIKETYFELFSHIVLPERIGIIRLLGEGDLARPNYLRLPNNVLSIDYVKYRDSDTNKYKELTYLNPEDFWSNVMRYDGTEDDLTTVTDVSGFTYFVKNNKQPSCYTILNDEYLVTDGYNETFDATLQSSKTFAWGETEETWSETDGFTPNLDNDLFPLFLAEAKSTCFMVLKQMANQKEEQRSRRGRVHLQYRKWRDKNQRYDEFKGPNYARNR